MTSGPREIAERLRRQLEGGVTEGALLGPYTTFRVGGPVDLLVEVDTPDELAVVAEVVADTLPVVVVGRGSNLLVSDEGFRGVAVKLGRGFRAHERTEEGLYLGGAVYLPAAARLTARFGLTGFEFAAEVPGNFGGAVRMNAGAHGRSMADVLLWADIVDLVGGHRRRVGVDELDYAYRSSNLGATDVVLGGEVRLQAGAPEEVGARIAGYLRWRREHQPPGRSAGSVFKNPPDDSAGRLIDAAGGKGMRVGGAEVSRVHANFIVVDRGARAADVWKLIWLTHQLVRERFGVNLEPEVRFVGSFPQVKQDVQP